MPRSEHQGLLILDTHVWVWLFNNEPQIIGSPALPAIDRATNGSQLRVCAMSVWEIGMLHSKGRLQLTSDPLDWARNALAAPGLALVPLSPEIAIESTRLPGAEFLHGDPVDRIIAASARLLGATVATRDRGLLDYARRGFMRALRV